MAHAPAPDHTLPPACDPPQVLFRKYLRPDQGSDGDPLKLKDVRGVPYIAVLYTYVVRSGLRIAVCDPPAEPPAQRQASQFNLHSRCVLARTGQALEADAARHQLVSYGAVVYDR